MKRPLFTSADAKQLGISSSLLNYYARKGLIERIDRGIYRGISPSMDVDFQWEDLVLAVKSIPDSAVCLISALALYDLSDEIPRLHWIAIDNYRRVPKRRGTKIVRMRNMSLGKVIIHIGSESLPIFDRERTIIDAFRYLGKETAIKALKRATSVQGPDKIDLNKLKKYAKEFRINIDHYILAVTV
ncbi:MAG: type IV toxin-antitoxin system AbiEi family antitoxin domain-containing protein [Spirochaetales bacterium]|nr:type IV toxin-antitoxin system AbiEi family antitoxin domain-containing protein [Spirochaetales bacterium]